MSKQFVSTSAAADCHEADVCGVAVSKPFTATVSGDGYLKLWSNKVNDADNVKEHVQSVFVDGSGAHHVAIYETEQSVLVGVTTFSGQLKFYVVKSEEIVPKKISVKIPSDSSTNWALAFLDDQLVVTQATGNTKIYNVEVENEAVQLTLADEIVARVPSFASCVAVCEASGMVAVGYSNGDLVVAQAEEAKPVFTVRGSSAIRSVAFSPSGEIVACGVDSGNKGSVILYDAKYGESLGNLSQTGVVGSSISAHDGWIFALDFSPDGSSVLSAGYDGKIRVWNVKSREREATLTVSASDFDTHEVEEADQSAILDAKFIAKGIRRSIGSVTNVGIVVVGMDRGIRWYREAGGI